MYTVISLSTFYSSESEYRCHNQLNFGLHYKEMYMRLRVHCIYKHFVIGCFFLLCTLGTSWSHQNQISDHGYGFWLEMLHNHC